MSAKPLRLITDEMTAQQPIPETADCYFFTYLADKICENPSSLFAKGYAVFQLENLHLPDRLDGTMLQGIRANMPADATLEIIRRIDNDLKRQDYMVVTQKGADPRFWNTRLAETDFIKIGTLTNGYITEIEPHVPAEALPHLHPEHRAVRLHAFAVSCSR